jgi:hypothetical protein
MGSVAPTGQAHGPAFYLGGQGMNEHETILGALKKNLLDRQQIRLLIRSNELQTLRVLNEMCALKLIYCNELTRQYAVLEQGPESAA